MPRRRQRLVRLELPRPDRCPQGDTSLCVTYWMNRLQSLPVETSLFVTLNPITPPAPVTGGPPGEFSIIHGSTPPRCGAQKSLWSIQGEGGVWWCGAYFGAGFHEDGLQSGLAVAEAIGGVAPAVDG